MKSRAVLCDEIVHFKKIHKILKFYLEDYREIKVFCLSDLSNLIFYAFKMFDVLYSMRS